MRTVLLSILLAGCAPRYAPRGPIGLDALGSAITVRHVAVDGINLAYEDSGGTGPAVVLVHGLSSSLGFWDRQVAAYSQAGFRVLALDLPGYGASDRPDAPYTPSWYAGLIDRWMGVLGLDHAVVIGHSMGGQISIFLALDHSHRVERLVLAAPAGLERFTPGEAAWMKEYWHEGRTLESDEEAVRTNFHMVFNKPDPLVERLIEERVRLAHTAEFAGTSVAVSRSVAGMLDEPVWGRLGEIQQQTLILFGTDDRLIPNPVFHGGRTASVAKLGLEAIPGSRLLLLPGAGHGLQLDAADAFNSAVIQFLGAP